jgi:cytochrome P450
MIEAVLGSKSLLSIDKDQWISKRKAFAPGFSPKFLRNMVETMIEKLQRFENCIDADISNVGCDCSHCIWGRLGR